MANPAPNASRGLESGTSPMTPAARPQADVVAITLSDDFLLELSDVLAGQATSVRPVDTAEAAVELLWSSRRSQLLVLDTRDCEDVHGQLAYALQEAPHAVALVFTPEGQEDEVSDVLAGLPIQAVLPIPLDRRKTALALDAAFADAALRKPTGKRPSAAAAPLAESLDSEPAPSNRIVLWVGATLATVALAGGAAWYLRSKSPTTAVKATAALPAAPLAPAPITHGTDADADESVLVPQKLIETTLLAGKLDDLLEKARAALRERHYTEPAGDNALLYYRSAHAVDENNAEANDGMQRVATVLLSRFEEALTAGRLEEAATSLANLKQAIPGDARLPGMELRLTDKQMGRLLAEGNFDTANKLLAKQTGVVPPAQLAKYRADIEHRQADFKIERLGTQANDALRDGRLEGGEDSARSFVQQLQALAPNSAVTQRTLRELNAAYLRRARESKNPADQEHWLQNARAGGMGPAEIEGVRREIAATHQKQQQAENDRLLGLLRERLRDGRLSEPASDSAVSVLGQLQAADPTGADATTAARELTAKLLDRARSSVNGGKSPDADLALARRFGADPKDISAVQALAASRAAPPPPSAAPVVRNAPAAGAAPEGAPGGLVPKKIRNAAPEFPESAVARNLSGSVTVTFTVDTNGDPRDIRVVEATPPGVFDRAAMAAVKRWKYQPTVVDGKPVEVPVQTTMRFAKPQ